MAHHHAAFWALRKSLTDTGLRRRTVSPAHMLKNAEVQQSRARWQRNSPPQVRRLPYRGVDVNIPGTARVPSRASRASTSDKKRSIRVVAAAGVVKTAGGDCGSGIARGDASGAIAERISSLFATGTCARMCNTGVLYDAFVGEFLTERFGAGPVDLSLLCAPDITGFVQRRASTIHSKRVQLMTTALRSFLRFARHRGDIEKDLHVYRPWRTGSSRPCRAPSRFLALPAGFSMLMDAA